MSAQVTHAILGTAGHIDHGKTALIRALTGQETDRLKEERERGISIELGFAFFTLPDGTRAGVVDVPGHERFIRNMLAGAHGIDLVLFTIAADDGVMPQSEEHLDILHLLGTRRGIFVITKADLADAARIAEVRDEIELLAEGTTLEGAPVVAVSALTGAGMDDLRTEIVRGLEGFEARRATGIFRLPIDRSFAIKGHGAVVTGTAIGAEVRVGQKLRVLPAGDEVRVRAIQMHSEAVESAGRCQRVALNLAGAERLELRRGLVLADDKLDFATTRFDASLEIRPAAKRPVRANSRVRLFVATAETIGRVILLEDKTAIAPKERCLVQIVAEDPIVALGGDHFVIRDETNMRTLGGGVVLNPLGRRVRKPLERYRNNLASLRDSTASDALEAMIDLQESLALSPMRARQLLNVPEKEITTALKDARFIKLSVGDEEAFTTRAKWDALGHFALTTLKRHHAAEPLAAGLEMEAMRSQLPWEVGARTFRSIIDRLARETGIVRDDSVLRLPTHQVHLGGAAGEFGTQLLRALEAAAYQPPDLAQLAANLDRAPATVPQMRTVAAALEREGKIVKVATDLYFTRNAIDRACDVLSAFLSKHPEVTAATYRDLLGTSRKFAIALLDYFDHSGVTIRVGDARRLRARTG
jgi:selenocysteine-specific elongation factor